MVNMQKIVNYIIILLLITVFENTANNVYKDVSNHPQNPSYFIQMLRSPDVVKEQFVSNNTRPKGSSSDMPITSRVKKQNVNRVSQKQYEVINMLWRKTKIFVDIEATTATYQTKHRTTRRKSYSTVHKNTFQISLPRPLTQISTPSYIEFYYIHEIDDRVKEKKSPTFNIDIRIAAKSGSSKQTEFIPNNNTYEFNNYFKKRLLTPHPQSAQSSAKLKEQDKFLYYVDFFTHNVSNLFNKKGSKSNTKALTKNKNHKNEVTSLEILFGNETCPMTTLQEDETNDVSKHPIGKQYLKSRQQVNNKIKSPEENEITYEKILLEHVDENTGHDHNLSTNKTKHSKKHINIPLKSANDIQNKHQKKGSKLSTMLSDAKMNCNTEWLKVSPSYDLSAEFTNRKTTANNYVNRSASWSEYRFVAVYVYEPLQVHCDAAGISPHWLITAGSCLARHHKNPGGDGLSAYVTYCGDNWWNPERVSYVKHSLVHPRYHPRNRIRRHLYNIGIIQVVNSMVSACPGWSPVNLMSHHFSASSIDPRATAVGWGLDRFDARYTVTDLPKSTLMMYEAPVYSDSCPGNIGYSKAKELEDSGGVRNVYCLSLPPYIGEENDPVHGSLLLVGGKLIALYLQEERRTWGEQCALYTGTWRLVPWVMENARESDESDIFTVDI